MCNEPYAGNDNMISRVRADLHYFTGADRQSKPRAFIIVHKSLANHSHQSYEHGIQLHQRLHIQTKRS